ncbi:CDP-archaeol synthase [Thiocystis violacea]|uniref:CDP-archaeol synthase n=1 Tax=Thiocystis violacea TaxID=13725 RepID=UPI001F5BC736|nr:CDP-archaeol synthase [Thiocystis violacea]
MLAALILVTWANASPVLARLLLGSRWARPVDSGRLLWDGRPILGGSKTWRGWVASGVTTPLVALLLGFSWCLGLWVAAGAMLGDAIASFAKRRLGVRASQSVLVLDQAPESLLPLLVLREPLALSALELLLVALGFFVIDLVLTPLVTGRHARPGR